MRSIYAVEGSLAARTNFGPGRHFYHCPSVLTFAMFLSTDCHPNFNKHGEMTLNLQ
jgi:hypothetical protein